ncbi:MAG: HAD family phosphatase [Paracoccaceae bacterium]
MVAITPPASSPGFPDDRPQAVLFDCDGVIVDSEGPTFDLLIEDLARHGLSLTRHQLESDYIGGTIESVATRARAAGATLPADWVADLYVRMYDMLAQGTPLIPGIVQVFDRLDAAGLPYAVGSNGTPHKMQITLGQHGLIPRFRAVLSGQEIGRPKPAPDLYLLAALQCAADPAACVVIEDSPSGAQAALAAGIPCLGFAPHGPDAPPASKMAALGIPLFDSMRDLPARLGL